MFANFRLVSAILALREMQREEDLAWQEQEVTERCKRWLDAMLPPPTQDATPSKEG